MGVDNHGDAHKFAFKWYQGPLEPLGGERITLATSGNAQVLDIKGNIAVPSDFEDKDAAESERQWVNMRIQNTAADGGASIKVRRPGGTAFVTIAPNESIMFEKVRISTTRGSYTSEWEIVAGADSAECDVAYLG